MQKSKEKSSLYIPSLTFKEIEQKVSHTPALILPTGGMEPVGELCSLGAVQEIVMAISACISVSCNILLNPLLPYTNTTSFRAFGGSCGVKKNIYKSLLTNLIKDCSVWGIRYFFIIDGCYNSYPVIQKVITRIEKNKKIKTKVLVFNWQHDRNIQSFIKTKFNGLELGRSELGILSMISYIHPSLIRSFSTVNEVKTLCKEEIYRRWMKRGQDPEKFRKLFPNCNTSVIENDIDPKFGKELFEYIVTYFEDSIKKTIQ